MVVEWSVVDTFALLWLEEYCVLGRSGDLSSWGVGQGSRFRLGQELVAIGLPKTFEDDLENFVVGNCVGFIEVIFHRSLLVNVKTFDRFEQDAFCLEL